MVLEEREWVLAAGPAIPWRQGRRCRSRTSPGNRYSGCECFPARTWECRLSPRRGYTVHHSCARIEADVRGVGGELTAEFPRADPALSDALLYCDMTTGPDGDYVRPAERLAEIRARCGPEHEVTRFVERAAPGDPGDGRAG